MAKDRAGVYAVSGIWIRLPEERWQHIIEEHPELEGLHDEVLLAIERPCKVLAGSRGELLAIREMEAGKYLVVVYKETSKSDGFVITSFLTRRARQLEKRVIVWPKQ
ncbi:hypothetical protein V3F56_03585 [Moorellaceae bacterium AZ2]